MVNKQYLSKKKQEEILRLFGEGKTIKNISNSVQEPAKIVSDFLEQHGHKIDYKYAYEVHGHIQLAHFHNLYEHQYVAMKELKLKIGEVRKYIIHHQNFNKQDNNISNLWLFYDQQMHILWHTLLRNEEVEQTLDDIYIFTKEYTYKMLADLQADIKECIIFSEQEFREIEQEINTYLKRVQKLYKIAKKMLY